MVRGCCTRCDRPGGSILTVIVRARRSIAAGRDATLRPRRSTPARVTKNSKTKCRSRCRWTPAPERRTTWEERRACRKRSEKCSPATSARRCRSVASRASSVSRADRLCRPLKAYVHAWSRSTQTEADRCPVSNHHARKDLAPLPPRSRRPDVSECLPPPSFLPPRVVFELVRLGSAASTIRATSPRQLLCPPSPSLRPPTPSTTPSLMTSWTAAS